VNNLSTHVRDVVNQVLCEDLTSLAPRAMPRPPRIERVGADAEVAPVSK
jgi:hypothetical protein